jgi:hypothetical protein
MGEAMQDYEKLGVFYLGKPCSGRRRDRRRLGLGTRARSHDHAVCVGMTGCCDKTGLCVGLIEGRDRRHPGVVIDPRATSRT